jgi:hypothetical protein
VVASRPETGHLMYQQELHFQKDKAVLLLTNAGKQNRGGRIGECGSAISDLFSSHHRL